MEYIAYLGIGFGIGYLMTLAAPGGSTRAERAREELEFAKERIKMFGARK